MPLAKRYTPAEMEPTLQARWLATGVYRFSRESARPIYSIDTPPATVSGRLHLGHVYSYSQTDFMARFARMNGANVFYPMGFDDNGLPTERLVEKTRGVRATEIGRQAFIQKCLAASEEAEQDYRALWQRLGLSVDWTYTYRTIDERSRKTAQTAFLDLYAKGLAYQQEAPAIWCPECRTAIAQAELADLERDTTFYTLAFPLDDGELLPIATTRPELLAACVAIFVHPSDSRYAAMIGRTATAPLFGQRIPILADERADPEKGTGAVMCCTFGDATDVDWWRAHRLPLRVTLGRDGRLTELAGAFAGLTAIEARASIVAALAQEGVLTGQQQTRQSARVHERCDTPVEYVIARQWFVRVLDFKERLLAAGEQINWRPATMRARYQEWVEGLRWDWCISRQRFFGVPFPLWYCQQCGTIVTASRAELPSDPTERRPTRRCACGSDTFQPEEDVMDTWATSSLSPQIVGDWLADPALYERVAPFTLRTQAHEIIRTWAFYTIVQSLHQFGTIPWSTIAISGWGLAAEGEGKISKSRGGGPAAPLEMIERYSADALRYWAASTGFGKDSIISEDKIAVGAKLATKLWNVARFAERFIERGAIPTQPATLPPVDHWLLARLNQTIERVTALFQQYDYAAAKSELEAFFWRDLADNYIEFAKLRLYEATHPDQAAARHTLGVALRATIALFAPFLPYVTEAIYQGVFAPGDATASLHGAAWPTADAGLVKEAALSDGETLIAIATAVRRYKSEANLSLGAELATLWLATPDARLGAMLQAAEADLRSVTRAQRVGISDHLEQEGEVLATDGPVALAITRL